MVKKKLINLKKFTYGAQFSPESAEINEYIKIAIQNEPKRDQLEKVLREKFFNNHSSSTSQEKKEENQKKLAMNNFLSLKEYQLVEFDGGDKNIYKVTKIAKEIYENEINKEEMYDKFAYHILTNLSGTDLVKSIETILQRNENLLLQNIITELNEMGYELSKNSVYVSTMRQWLMKANLFDGKKSINWEKFFSLTSLNKHDLFKAYALNPHQKAFLLEMIKNDVTKYTSWNKLIKNINIDFDMKMFPKVVLNQLESFGLIETEKSTEGRGAKPNSVRLTEKSRSEFLKPFLDNMSNLVSIEPIELNKTFDEVLNEVKSEDKYIKGKALELLAIWMIRLSGLRFIDWRKRDNETGSGEVDVLAASDSFTYSRWQIQCKNTKTVHVDHIAKEVGMTFQTNADVIMFITTGKYTSDAIQFSDNINSRSRYYIILLDENDLHQISNNITSFIDILDKKAKLTFMKKEYFMKNDEIEEFIHND